MKYFFFFFRSSHSFPLLTPPFLAFPSKFIRVSASRAGEVVSLHSAPEEHEYLVFIFRECLIKANIHYFCSVTWMKYSPGAGQTPPLLVLGPGWRCCPEFVMNARLE